MCGSQKSLVVNLASGTRALLAAVLLLLAVPCLAAATSETPPPPTAVEKIPFKRTQESTGGIAFRLAGGLVITVLIGIGAIYAMKRYLPSVYGQTHAPGGTSRIQVVETRRLTPKTTLYLVEVDGARLLLAQTGDSIATLHQQPPPGSGNERA
ncbi:MAG: flagellar biosynthetic protein FliO [Gammaproteobacteria bacterium]|nr:flagellar biosynthetic protein FliO [Gammaproteobacteria bacterium]